MVQDNKNIENNVNNETCPKCKSNDIVFHGNWTGVMVSDIYAEHFWMCKCKSCGFTFLPSSEDSKPDPINFKRDYA